jgi:hypothetical protein
MAVSDYSTTAASNTAISGIDITGATGLVKNGDNALRQMMADIKAGVPYLSGTTIVLPSGATGGLSYSSTASGSMLTMTSTAAVAASGPNIDGYRNSASPSAGDVLMDIIFSGADNGGNKTTYSSIVSAILDPTNGSEDARIILRTMLAGTLTQFMVLSPNAGSNAISLPLGQLLFPATANPSSDANTLDDYEEGTFTPTVTASGCTFSWNTIAGTYTKVGNLVTGWIYLQLNTTGNTLAANAVTIGNLPFSQNAVTQYVSPFAWSNTTGSYINLSLLLASGGTSGTVRGMTAAGTSSVANVNADQLFHATNGTALRINFAYSTA